MSKSRILSVGNYSGISEWPLNAVAYVLIVKWSESRSVVSDSLRPHGLHFGSRGLYSPWNSLGQNTGMGSLSLLQGIFPSQGSNPGLRHCRRILYQLSRKGSPYVLIRGEANGNLIPMEEEKAVWPQRQRMDTKDCWQPSEARRCKEVGRRFLPQTVQRYSSSANTGFQPADTNFVLQASRSVIE